MSLQSHPSLSLLSGDCGHLEKTDAYLGLWCKSPLKWVLTVIPSHCLGWQLSWGNNLMIPCLMNTGQRNEWKCVLKGIFETCIVYQVAFHECGPLHQSGLTPAIYYIHIYHTSALRDTCAIIISEQPHTTGHVTSFPAAVDPCMVY